jgi:PGF-CTERM protein
MNKKIRMLYVIIVFSAIIGVGIVDAQEYTIEAALSSYGLEEPKVSISGNEVTIEYKQPVSEFGSMNEEFKKIAKILTIVADEHPTAYHVIIRQYFDDGQIMELVGKPEDGKAFLNYQISEETFSERLEFNPLTRGPPIIPGTCEPDKGENCENCVECVCYPNEFCDSTNPEADKKGCVVKYIPSNSQLVGSEYVCDEGYKWNSDLTGCVLENTVGGDSKYTTPKLKPKSTPTVPISAQKITSEECNNLCIERYGAGMGGKVIDGQCQCWSSKGCEGEEGYVKTAQGWVKATEEDCQRACSSLMGEKVIGSIDDGTCKCSCEEGYTLNEEKTKCIRTIPTPTRKPQTPAPTYNYDDDYIYDDSVPGFEAIYAIAGLLSVAYLVLRKRK